MEQRQGEPIITLRGNVFSFFSSILYIFLLSLHSALALPGTDTELFDLPNGRPSLR